MIICLALPKEITVTPGLTLSVGTFGKCTFFCFPETSHFCFWQHQWLWCFWACGGPVEFRNSFSGQCAYVRAILRCVYFFLVSGLSCYKGSLQVPTIDVKHQNALADWYCKLGFGEIMNTLFILNRCLALLTFCGCLTTFMGKALREKRHLQSSCCVMWVYQIHNCKVCISRNIL